MIEFLIIISHCYTHIALFKCVNRTFFNDVDILQRYFPKFQVLIKGVTDKDSSI